MRSRPLTPAALTACALLAACGAGGEKASLPAKAAAGGAVGVRAVQPETKLAGGLVRATGQLRARQEATLSAPATGTIAKLLVDVGDPVKAGQPLVVLDTSNIVIAVEQARAARAIAAAGFDAASQELERAKQLRASDSAPQAALDRTLAAHRQAAAGLEAASVAVRSAEEALRDHTLRAPFDGVITARHKGLGETVAMMPPTAVVTIVDTRRLEVRLPVPETVIGALRPGAALRGKVSPSGRPFDAKVRAVGAVVDPMTRTVEVLADVEGAGDLRPGSLVEVELGGVEGATGVFLPAQTVQRQGESSFVWVVHEQKAVRRPVTIEPLTPGTVRVLTGVSPDEQVVADGAASLQDGAAVRVIQ